MSNSNLKTGICKYAFIGCKQQQKCWYAHNKEELRQRHCVNGINCNDNNCCFLHPNKNVDKDEYFFKILLKSDVLGIDKNNIKKQLDILNSKIIIDIDLDYDEIDDNDIDELDLNKMNINDNENNIDIELKQYIENFTEQWSIKPQQFYNLIDNKNEITLKVKANDLQIQLLTRFMETMKIEFDIESFCK
jgi:hypothetical protein